MDSVQVVMTVVLHQMTNHSVSVILTVMSMETAVLMCLMWKTVLVSAWYSLQWACLATRIINS